jgi:hypothetical protein
MWTEPNADFVPILSSDQFMHLKSFDWADKGVMLYPASLGIQPERQVVRIADAFDSARIDICHGEGELLQSVEAIIGAVFANRPLVARTQIEGRLHGHPGVSDKDDQCKRARQNLPLQTRAPFCCLICPRRRNA